ncbi:MAG: hypothetical protein FWE50_00130 [Alphaproteobacteria bacterium]|nr:hypothetical protein [Alphaproteobacteria bacterium]
MTQKSLSLPGSTLGCAVGLKGAQEKHRDILPELSSESLAFVDEWTCVLLDTVKKSGYKKHTNLYGHLILFLRDPKYVANFIDFADISHRSFYYALRFANAHNFAADKIKDNNYANVVDFGAGLSPLLPLLKQNNNNINNYSLDSNSLIQDIRSDVLAKLGLPQEKAFDWPPQNDIFLSLGTFVYIPEEQQKELLAKVNENCRDYYIEFELKKTTTDKMFVKKQHDKYYPLGADAVKQTLYNCNIKLMSDEAERNSSAAYSRLKKTLPRATEAFVYSR